MKTFITPNFLLSNKTAETLYHEYAADAPIIDYHCHLPPAEIAENKHFRSITELWLDYDHYKWRAMRAAGIPEELVTGGRFDAAKDKARFEAWAKVLPQALGNPLYHWTHLEMLRFFDIEECLSPGNAGALYDAMNKRIAQDDFSTHAIIQKFGVKFIGTTDDPADSLEHHKVLKNNKIGCTVAPSWRPDKAMKVELPSFADYVLQVAEAAAMPIGDFDTYIEALRKRILLFKERGCIASDHGLDEFVFTRETSRDKAAAVFAKALRKQPVSREEMVVFKSWLMLVFGGWYNEHSWVMQLHIGAQRNNNTLMFNKLGADSGYDSISAHDYARALSDFLDELCIRGALPKTVLYSVNPRDNEVLAAMAGNFQGGGRGRIQYGSGWWFNDQKDGMERQLTALASIGLLPLFIGMLTDSRSFLSYPRHEYFRRILCNLIGSWAEKGEAPKDLPYLGGIVRGICCGNASEYFQIPLR